MEISPMLLTEVDDKNVLERTDRVFQEKFNGVRSIIHVKDHKIVGIRGRTNNPLLYCFPELKDVTFEFDNAILDAEIIVEKNGKSIFYSGIDQRRSTPDSKKLKDYPVTAIVFDVLVIGGVAVINQPYKDRLAILQGYKWSDKVRLIESSTDGKKLWDWIIKENREGVVVRDPHSVYELGIRSKAGCLKLKNYKFVDVVVEKTEPNPKGTKIYSHTSIDGVDIVLGVQQAGMFNINVGDTIRVKYLDIIDGKLVQPTRT